MGCAQDEEEAKEVYIWGHFFIQSSGLLGMSRIVSIVDSVIGSVSLERKLGVGFSWSPFQGGYSQDVIKVGR